ncbi:hypothetical protein PT974_00554 [Cladobotryum mycophilum]|uniref:LysM domain-containing protein n=1 Tax=Cladobotryum mycophilum TaxID=491253 RepID=A0ABR0T1D1_9HYPO
MADPKFASRQSSYLSSSTVKSASQSTGSSSVRSRNRRQASSNNNGTSQELGQPRNSDTDLLPISHRLEHRSRSQQSSRWPNVSPSRKAGTATLGQFLGDSWNQSWTSVQGFATSLLAAGEEQIGVIGRSESRNRPSNSKTGFWGRERSDSNNSTGKNQTSWGPAPPSRKPGIDDVATGSSAEREAALKAARTASVLESHEGVNGGLDITGKYKRRNSDEISPESSQSEEYLVYIHTVQPTDTYAGLILRYKCREDAFRKANGLWSRDSIQIRKWLVFPVDACDIRGRPCDAPLENNTPATMDLLVTNPPFAYESLRQAKSSHDDPFYQPDEASGKKEEEKDMPWTHFRWVQIDSFPEPVEIGRVSRQAMGYFPPRRKKSVRTTSSLSTPRQSFDIASPAPGASERPVSRRQSSLSNQPRFLGSPASTRSRAGSDAVDTKPAWMRRPGGVGSMGRNVRAPGPDRDYLNTWTKKHLPGLNIDELPSMSVMGSETARLGFTHDSSGIVESPFEDGRDAVPDTRQGNGLDKAAAAVENWLRGALSKNPTTPLIGSIRGRPVGQGGAGGDLIELSNTPGDDGRSSYILPNTDGGGVFLADSTQRAKPTSVGLRSRKDDQNLF